jgi:HlyD family secretion protein
LAPGPASVEDVFFRPGEWVAANQPVLALLPDSQVKVRFFVPEREVARYRPGRTIRFACDACPSGLSARITYVSPRPEFTPPIIYSRDSRDRLVFMVEALPDRPRRLMPGLPVDVEPLP